MTDHWLLSADPQPFPDVLYAAHPIGDGRTAIVYEPHGTHRATTYDPKFAEFACKACNSYADLVAALQRIVAVDAPAYKLKEIASIVLAEVQP